MAIAASLTIGAGHGRSSQPWDGNGLNTYADDLAQLVEESSI
jgi:non-heme chloroperoxidase